VPDMKQRNYNATERVKIEKAIFDHLVDQLAKYGFVMDRVLLRDIFMPEQLTRAIQTNLKLTSCSYY